MDWARDKHPELIGHTSMPAYNWYTPRQMSRLLVDAGCSRTFDRWELKRDDEVSSGLKRGALRAARRWRPVRFAGDVAIQGLSLLAIK